MNRLALALVLALLAGLHTMSAQPSAQADKLMASAQHKASVEGDLKGAIEVYRQVVASAGTNRSLAATALLAMADCYEKLGQREATAVYQRIVREFSDQSESVSLATSRLSAIQSGARAPVAQTAREVWSGAGVDRMGSPSADGRYLTFTDWETGDLAIRDLSTNTSRRLTNAGTSEDFSEYSVLSSDGRQVAFAWFIEKGSEPGSCFCRYDIRIASTASGETGKARVLLQTGPHEWVRPIAFTPDARQLVILRSSADDHHELALITVADGSLRVLKSLAAWDSANDTASLSPDGRSLVYSAGSPGSRGRDILLLTIDGTTETTIIQSPGSDRTPVWTADGAHVLFISDRSGSDSLWRVPMYGERTAGPPVMVMANVSGNSGLMGASRNGALYYWAGGQSGNVYFANLDANMKVTGTPAIGIERFLNSNGAPSWSPDGNRLAYLSYRGASRSVGPPTLMIHTISTGDDREVSLRISPGTVSWFPDGRAVLLASLDRAEGRFTYYRIDLATGAEQSLMRTKGQGTAVGRPQVSPDGRTIVFADRDANELPTPNGASRLMRFDIASGQQTELARASKAFQIMAFAISPDGQDVAYIRQAESGPIKVVEVVAASGGPVSERFRDTKGDISAFGSMAWTRDKRFLLVPTTSAASARPSFWKLPVAGGPAEETGIAVAGARTLRFPALDPQGGRIAFAAPGDGPAQAIWVLENFLPAPR